MLGRADELWIRRRASQAASVITVVRCDEAAWRYLGLSLAGYNVLISLVLAAIAALGAAMEWRGRMARS